MAELPSRERLIREAIRLFSERGYRETTVGGIEKAAGLTPRAGGFYRHFTSKEDIVVEALERMGSEMIAELTLEEVLSLRSPREELLAIARALIRHAETYRPLRLLVQREAYKAPVIRDAARRLNARLATLDVIPWLEDVLRRCGGSRIEVRELGLMIFGPVLTYIFAQDRDDRAFGLGTEDFLVAWADHWAGWLNAPRADP